MNQIRDDILEEALLEQCYYTIPLGIETFRGGGMIREWEGRILIRYKADEPPMLQKQHTMILYVEGADIEVRLTLDSAVVTTIVEGGYDVSAMYDGYMPPVERVTDLAAYNGF